MRYEPSVDALLRRSARIFDDQVAGAADTPGAAALFDDIVALPRRLAPETTRRPARSWRVAAAVAAAVCAGAFVVTEIASPPPAAAGITIRTRDGFYVARVTDPEASSAELSAAFTQLGLDIELQLTPVSPSLVGTVVAIGDGGDGRIETLSNPNACVTGGGSCPIGLRIPLDFQGSADITLGRAAEPGETYVGVADALAPGEPLHCSALYGVPVERALAEIDDRGLSVTVHALVEEDGRDFAREVEPSDVRGWYVHGLLSIAHQRVLVEAAPRRAVPLPPAYGARLTEGC